VKDIVEEWLVEEDRAQHAGVVADEHLENLEARPAGRTDAARNDFTRDRGGRRWP
jgi:hypothetical protein